MTTEESKKYQREYRKRDKFMKIIINIISLYSPGRRYKNFIEMIKILKKKNFDVNVVLQEYPSNLIDYIDDLGAEIITCRKKNCEHARNVFLKIFYESNYDYFLLLDDDILLNKKLKTPHNDIIKYLIKQIQYYNCGLYTCEENNYSWRHLKNPYIKQRLDFWGGCCIMKNFKKFHNLKIYFSENLIALGEIDFACKMWRKKLTCYFDRGFSSFCQIVKNSTYGNVEERNKKNQLARVELVKKNSDFLKLNSLGHLMGMTIKNVK